MKDIEEVGEKWGAFQTINFNAASQPFYVLLSPDLTILNSAIQNTDSNTYRAWLETGLKNYEQHQQTNLVSQRNIAQ